MTTPYGPTPDGLGDPPPGAQGGTGGKGDSALMKILRGTDDDVKMSALEKFRLKPSVKSYGEGNFDDYSTEVAPDSYDELRDAVGLGLITMAQIEALRRFWAARETGDGPAQRAGTWKPPATEA